MGSLVSRPPESAYMGGPILENIFTDLTRGVGDTTDGKCTFLQLRLFDCMEAHGSIKGYEACADTFQDFQECVYGFKQKERARAIKQERLHQWGKRVMDGDFSKPYYEPPPPLDSYHSERHNTENEY